MQSARKPCRAYSGCVALNAIARSSRQTFGASVVVISRSSLGGRPPPIPYGRLVPVLNRAIEPCFSSCFLSIEFSIEILVDGHETSPA